MTKSDCIIFSYSFDADGRATKLGNEMASKELKSKDLSWVHLDGKSKETKKWLNEEVTYLDHLIIDALTVDETRPRIIEFDRGLLIILRGINVQQKDLKNSNNSRPQDMVSMRMWIDEERIITIQRRGMKSIFDLRDQIDGGKVIKNCSDFLHYLITQILLSTSPFLYSLGERIDLIEQDVAVSHNLKFRDEILHTRSQLTIFKRYLTPQKEVIARLQNSSCPWIDELARRHFHENFDQITHMIEEAEEVSSRSKILHDELSHDLNEKINRNMLKLSLVALIFMPLTFFTGVYGMNFRSIPGADNPYGFYIFCATMLLIASLQIMFFKRKDWF